MSTKVRNKGKDLAQFRAAHDKSFIVPKKIREALAELGDGWEYEKEFVQRCGLAQVDFAAYRDEFTEYYVSVGGKNPKRCWAGTKTYAKKMQDNLR